MPSEFLDIYQRYYNPEYADWYRKRMQERYAQEIPAAQAITEGAMSGATSQALAQQRMGLGQLERQQAAAGVGGALAARQAAYQGAQAGSQLVGQAAQGRAAEIAGGREAELGARLRQLDYGAGLASLDVQRRGLMEQARQAYAQREFEAQQKEQAKGMKLGMGIMGGASALVGQAGKMGG